MALAAAAEVIYLSTKNHANHFDFNKQIGLTCARPS